MEIRTSTIKRLRDALLASGQRKSAVSSSAYRTLFTRGLLSVDENGAIARVAVPAESMFLVIAADEQVTDTELMALRGAVRGLTGDVLSDDIVHMMMEKYAQMLRDDGLEKRLSTIGLELESTEAQSAFALAAAVAFADGHVVAEEHLVLGKMRQAYGLTEEQVRNLLDELQQDR
jgi:prepilin-type processing-associated H-X9-DG protein